MRVYTPMRASAKSFKACRTCACSSLRRASRAVTQHYERHFRGSGLRATQFTILATLAQTGPLSISELSAPLGHDDQRVRKMTLTHKGIKKASAALVFWKRADSSVAPILRRFGLQSRPMVRAK